MSNNAPHPEEPPPASAAKAGSEPRHPASIPAPPPTADITVPTIGEPPPVQSLTPEEQMALFEKELKEKDWGHQPC